MRNLFQVSRFNARWNIQPTRLQLLFSEIQRKRSMWNTKYNFKLKKYIILVHNQALKQDLPPDL